MTGSQRPSLDELAAGEIDQIDLDVLGHMAQMYEALDPVPATLVERIQFGLTLDALHAEVAELQRSADLVGVRSAVEGVQSVTFTSSALSTMITVTPLVGDRVRVDGWISPGAGVAVELRTVDETFETTADEDGRFVFEDVPRGLAQFVLRPPNGVGGPVVTPSIEI
jgi:hypothetical protein